MQVPHDKWMHFSCSCILFIMAVRCGFDKKEAAYILFSIGFAKEILDMYEKGGTFDWHDMLANIIGIALGYLLCR
jgi:uncharacterized protein YfiM (DUF2279 family)